MQRTEHTLASADGTSLRCLRFAPKEDGSAAAWVVAVHGYAEHGERYRELAHHFAEHGIGTMAIDLRGHGHSQGRRGFVKRFDDYVADVEAALAATPVGPTFVLGHSNGGVVALELVARGTNVRPLAGCILTNPFLELAMQPPRWKTTMGNLAAHFMPTLALPSGIDPAATSRDVEMAAAYARDPLIFTTATAGWFAEVQAAQRRARAMRDFPAPLLYIYSDADTIGNPAANAALSERLRCADKTVWLRKDERHEVLNEVGRVQLHRDIAGWIKKRL